MSAVLTSWVTEPEISAETQFNLSASFPQKKTNKQTSIFLAKRGWMGSLFLFSPEFQVTHLRPLVDFNYCWQVVWLLCGFISTELPAKGPARHLQGGEAVPGNWDTVQGVTRDWSSIAACGISHRQLHNKNIFLLLAQPGQSVLS